MTLQAEVSEPSVIAVEDHQQKGTTHTAEKIEMLPDIVVGNPKAPHTLIIYESLSCHHCAAYEKEHAALVKEAFVDSGKLVIRRRFIPTNGIDYTVARLCWMRGVKQARQFVDLFLHTHEEWLNPIIEKDDAKKIALYEAALEQTLAMQSITKEDLIQELDLSPTDEFAFLKLFALRNGFSPQEIKQALQDDTQFDNAFTLTLNMARLKDKTGKEDTIKGAPTFVLDGIVLDDFATADVLKKALRFTAPS